MSTRKTWAKRGAVLGTVSALALGGAITFAGTASAEVDDATLTTTPVTAQRDADNVAAGAVSLTENEAGDLFTDVTETVEFTLVEEDGTPTTRATFDTESADNAVVTTGGGAYNRVETPGGDDVVVTGNTVTATITRSDVNASPTVDSVSISGLIVDVDSPIGNNDDIEIEYTGELGPDAEVEGDDVEDFLRKPFISLDELGNVEQLFRIGGQDRYETAAKAFRETVGRINADAPIPPEGEAPTVTSAVLAGGLDYPDALSASFLAGRVGDGAGTGILLTRPNVLSQDARQEIVENGIEKVYVVGGTTAVSAAVEAEVRNLRVGEQGDDAPRVQVVRLGGSDRYNTNARVNQYVDNGFAGASGRALVASGAGFADAVAFGPVAYATNTPLILTPGASLGDQARSQIREFRPLQVDVAGGTVSISDATFTAIEDEAAVDDVDRQAGSDRSATAAQIARFAVSDFPADFDVANTQVAVASGSGFADALVSAPLTGTVGTPTLLTNNQTTLGTGLEEYLGGINGSDDGELDVLYVFGLSSSIPQETVGKISDALGDGTDPDDENNNND